MWVMYLDLECKDGTRRKAALPLRVGSRYILFVRIYQGFPAFPHTNALQSVAFVTMTPHFEYTVLRDE
jgi:hypothetical protein